MFVFDPLFEHSELKSLQPSRAHSAVVVPFGDSFHEFRRHELIAILVSIDTIGLH